MSQQLLRTWDSGSRNDRGAIWLATCHYASPIPGNRARRRGLYARELSMASPESLCMGMIRRSFDQEV